MITFALLAFAATLEGNLQSVLDNYQSAQQLPGVAAVVTQGDDVIFAGASGVADLENGREMSSDTIFYVGSVSKVFTAALTLTLIENGMLSLDEVAFEASGEIVRVRHLLLHTSGLSREGDFEYWFNARFPDTASLQHYLANASLQFPPGTSYSYSNIAYAALGQVIERASGMSFEDALAHYLTSKLDLTRTGTTQPALCLAAGYSPVDGVLPNADRPFAGLGKPVGNRYVREYHNARAMTPAFGISASALDLSHFARALLGYGSDFSFPAALLAEMFSEQGNGRGYALRLETYQGRNVARHGGWFAAHRSHLLLDLDAGISVSVLTNSDSASPGKIAEGLLDITLQSKRARTTLSSP